MLLHLPEGSSVHPNNWIYQPVSCFAAHVPSKALLSGPYTQPCTLRELLSLLRNRGTPSGLSSGRNEMGHGGVGSNSEDCLMWSSCPPLLPHVFFHLSSYYHHGHSPTLQKKKNWDEKKWKHTLFWGDRHNSLPLPTWGGEIHPGVLKTWNRVCLYQMLTLNSINVDNKRARERHERYEVRGFQFVHRHPQEQV